MGLARVLLLSRRLRRLNRATPQAIARVREKRLRSLLRHAARHSPAYRELYDGIDLDSCRLEDLPAVTKAQMMGSFERFVTDSRIRRSELEPWMRDWSNVGKRYLGDFIPIWTSGSTGRRGIFVYSRKALELVYAAAFARRFSPPGPSDGEGAGRSLRSLLRRKIRIANLTFGTGPNPGHVGVRSFPGLPGLIADRRIFSLRARMDDLIDGLNDFQPDSITAFPSVIGALAREQLQGRLRLALDSPFSRLRAMSEPLDREVRDLARRAWGLEISDTYGAAECLVMAKSCRRPDRLVVMSDLCVIEVVDGDNRPVRKGVLGRRILLTNLFNPVQPVIRYEIDDITGYDAEPCACGLPFPHLLPITGRRTDVFYIDRPGGGREFIHSYVLSAPALGAGAIREHQLVQTGRNDFLYRYVPLDPAVDTEDRMRAALEEQCERLGLKGRIDVRFERVDGLEPDPATGRVARVVKEAGSSGPRM